MEISGDIDVSRLGDDELREVIRRLESQNEVLAESLADITLAIDDLGWDPLQGFDRSDHELSLRSLHKASEVCRSLVTINPLVKRGIAVRTSYIWGGGVRIGADTDSWYNMSVERTLGTTLAQLEIERTAAADGNLFFLVDEQARTVQRIPFWQIDGSVSAQEDSETIHYYRRSYNRVTTRLDVEDTSAPVQEQVTVWYPSDQLEGTPASRIGGHPVERRKRIVHVAFNKQVGWTWGVPDVFAVVFWSKAYKEFLENCATLQKAYSRFAWKITSSTKKGQQRVASRMAEPPSRDPVTGEQRNIGAAVTLGANQDMQALQTIRPVDFDSGTPLASMVAAGLEIPLPMLTSDPSSGNRATAETLDGPTELAMEARQNLMRDALHRVLRLLGASDVTVEFPPVSEEPLHRMVQAIDQAGRTGMLFDTEWRALLLKALDLEGVAEAPDEDEIPKVVQIRTEQNEQQQENLDAPAQPEPPSYGDHELRDEGGQAHTENT